MGLDILHSLAAAAQDEMSRLTQDLFAGRVSLPQWEISMAGAIKDGHLASGMLGAAGRDNMSQAMWGEAGSRIKAEYQYLHDFATGIADGSISEQEALRRAGMYGNDIWGSYADTQRATAGDDGNTEERRVLSAVENCPDCVSAAAQGWQPIGSLPDIGDSQCGSNCKCTFEFR